MPLNQITQEWNKIPPEIIIDEPIDEHLFKARRWVQRIQELKSTL